MNGKGEPMSDLIDRQVVITAIEKNAYRHTYLDQIVDIIKALPSAQPEIDEWCTDCKEYDQEKHCCPRFNRVIRNALKDAQPERKRGKWILWNYPGEECAICSACGEEYGQMELYIGGNDYPKFCPECGAKMEERE